MNFVCVYWGDKYKTDYVQNLYNMVQRHLTIPHKFICFTDHVKLHKIVKGDIEFRQFKHHDYQTWWNKLQLFSEDAELEGPNLYMDLDVVILENINEMATFGDDDTFGVINDFNPVDGRVEFYKGLLLIRIGQKNNGCEYLKKSSKKNYIGSTTGIRSSEVFQALCVNN